MIELYLHFSKVKPQKNSVSLLDNVMSNQHQHVYSEDEIIQLNHYFRTALQGEETQFELRFLNQTFVIYLSPIFENETVIEVVGTATDITGHKRS